MKRRQFLKIGHQGVFILPILFMDCQDSPARTDPCTDLSELTEADLKIRKSLSYVDASPYEDQLCDNCQYWIAAKEGLGCGGCVSIRGPIQAKGYCSYWAPLM